MEIKTIRSIKNTADLRGSHGEEPSVRAAADLPGLVAQGRLADILSGREIPAGRGIMTVMLGSCEGMISRAGAGVVIGDRMERVRASAHD